MTEAKFFTSEAIVPMSGAFVPVSEGNIPNPLDISDQLAQYLYQQTGWYPPEETIDSPPLEDSLMQSPPPSGFYVTEGHKRRPFEGWT